MAGPRRRRSRRRLGLGERLDLAGQMILLGLWSGLLWLLRTLLWMLQSCALAGIEWFQRQRLGVKLLALALTCASLVYGYQRWRASTEAVHVHDEVEALARVIRSEMGGGTLKQRTHIGWATRNLAAERDESVAEMACSPCGPQQRGRPVSSRQQALDKDRKVARAILAHPPAADPTGGATHFINPRLQDVLAKSGEIPGYKGNTYAKVRRRWIRRYKWSPYYRLGPELEMWGPRKK